MFRLAFLASVWSGWAFAAFGMGIGASALAMLATPLPILATVLAFND